MCKGQKDKTPTGCDSSNDRRRLLWESLRITPENIPQVAIEWLRQVALLDYHNITDQAEVPG